MDASSTLVDAALPPPPPRSRTRSAIFNWGSTAAYTVVTVLVAIVSTPLLLKFLGAERLGAFRVACEWFNYLALVEVGLGPAFNVIFIRAHAAGDSTRAASTLRLALRTFIYLAAVALPLGVLLAWSLPYLVPVGPELVREFRTAALLAQVGLLLTPFGVYRILLETQQRGYVLTLALIVQSLVVTSASIILAWLGFGLPGQSVALVLGLAALYFIIVRVAARDLPPLSKAPPSRISYRELWGLAWPFAITGLATRLNLLTDNIVVGFVLGPAAVFAFYVTQRLPQLVAAQTNGMVNATWAGLADLKVKGAHDVYEARIVELARLVIGLGLTLTGTAAAYNAAFVRLWVGPAQYGGDLLSAATAAALVVSGFQLLFAWALDIQGDARRRTKISIIGAVLNLVLSVSLACTRLGVAGVAIGTLAAYLLTEAWFGPYLVCKLYGVRAARLLAGCAKGVALGLPWAIAVWIFARWHAGPLLQRSSSAAAWARLLLECAAAGALSIGYCWIVILTREERSDWLKRLRRIIR